MRITRKHLFLNRKINVSKTLNYVFGKLLHTYLAGTKITFRAGYYTFVKYFLKVQIRTLSSLVLIFYLS
jgi:hypothetical protein